MTASISDHQTERERAREAIESTAVAYDAFTADHDYEQWTAMIESLAREHGLPPRGRLLDVGCGTGKSFLPWMARGWSVTGCDFASAMLAEAAVKAPSARLVQADARSLGDLGSFDLVLMLDDVVNLIPASDHPDVFRGVRRNLAPAGLLVFDLNTVRTFRTFFGATRVQERGGCVVAWQGSASPDFAPGEAAEAVMDAFVRDGGDRWRRCRGVHREYHHPLDDLERVLVAAGLEVLSVHGQDEACNVEPEPDELAHSKFLVIARRCADVRYVLRETVEAFPAGDGSIYFLRGGGDAEHVLADPTDSDRALLERLHAERTLDELHAVAPASEVDELLASLEGLGLLRRSTGALGELPGAIAERYDRQLLYFAAETGDDAQAAAAQRTLMQAAVCIIGCGGLGSWTAAALASAGIGRLVLVDDDTVAISNLNRQLLFRHTDIGRRKVDAAAEALRAFNPELVVEPVPRRITGPDDVARIADGASLIVATADSPPYAIARWINAGALTLGIPHIAAAQLPPLVRVGPLFVPYVTGCDRCQEQAARRDYPDYEGLTAYRERHDRGAAALGALSGLVGSVLAMDAVHFLTGVASPATYGKAVVIDARDLSVTKEHVSRQDGCEACAVAARP